MNTVTLFGEPVGEVVGGDVRWNAEAVQKTLNGYGEAIRKAERERVVSLPWRKLLALRWEIKGHA
jgi:hypothetical protein